MARLTEILSWFDKTLEMCWTAMATMKQMSKREKKKLCPPSSQPINKIEILLWVMEQADSSNPWVRRRWWAFRSRV